MGSKNKTWIATTASIIGFSLSCIVLTGWIFDIPLLRSIVPGLPAMIPMTATSIGLLSLGLFLSAQSVKNQTSIVLKTCTCVSLVGPFFLATMSALWHFSLNDIGIGPLFLSEKVARDEFVIFSGYMSLQTITCTMLIACGLFLFQLTKLRRTFLVFQTVLLLPIALAVLAVIGFLHGITFEGPSKYIGLSLPSTISFFLLAFGSISLVGDKGIVGALRQKTSRGFFLRWYTFFGSVYPILVTILIQWGRAQDFYPAVFSNALFVVIMIGSLLIMGYFMSHAVARLEAQSLAIEQAQAKAALRESETSLHETKKRLEIALAASSMGTWETHLIHGTSFWDKTTERLFGFAPNTFPQTFAAFKAIVHPDDWDQLIKKRAEAVMNHVDLDLDYRCIHPDGSIHWIRSKGRIEYENDKAVRISGTVRDITNEKVYQETLERALKEAESANQLKSSFLANMSHEIRTPLGAILGFTDLLSDPTLQKEDRDRYLKTIARNGESLSQILNDILDLSKVESGHLDVEKIRFHLKNTVNEVTSLLEFRALEKGITLTTEYGENLPASIVSDPVRLKQILINLLGNAIKFTSHGGVSLKVSIEGNTVFFAVKDSGIGIDAQQKAKLFQSFSQLHSSTTRLYGGTGLGLVLSRRLANLLGGNIELTQSALNEGSTFVISIHNSSGEEVRVKKQDQTQLQTDSLKGLKILLAEDSMDNQHLISFILAKEGMEVEVAQNGQEAVRKVSEKDYDLVLMDIQMPVLDGYDATEKIRADGYTLPIIALTAHAMNDVHQKCLEIGCDSHLTKPVNKNQLLQTIYDFTRR